MLCHRALSRFTARWVRVSPLSFSRARAGHLRYAKILRPPRGDDHDRRCMALCGLD